MEDKHVYVSEKTPGAGEMLYRFASPDDARFFVDADLKCRSYVRQLDAYKIEKRHIESGGKLAYPIQYGVTQRNKQW